MSDLTTVPPHAPDPGRLLWRWIAALSCVALVACGAAKPQATRHSSYVPPDRRPADVRRLIVLGDSIGAGRGASAPQLAYAWLLQANDATAWPQELATSLTAKYGHPVEMVNLAVPWATTNSLPQQSAALDRRLPPPVRGHSIVTITIGGNDFWGTFLSLGEPTPELLENAISRIRTLVRYLQDDTHFPDGTSIYLMTLYDPTDGVGQAPECFFGLNVARFGPALDAWRDRYMRLGAELHIAVIDALGAFRGHGFHHADPGNPYYLATDMSLWFAPDCVHPNDRGHSELRRLFFEAIDEKYVATP